jgi:hypothetical protein
MRPRYTGLQLLLRLLTWTHLVLPTAEALCSMLADALSTSAAALSMPACCRATLYRTSAALVAALGLPAAETIAPAVLRCAWAEFYVKHKSPAAEMQQRARKRARTKGSSADLCDVGDTQRAAAHAQRPAMLVDVASAQVRYYV